MVESDDDGPTDMFIEFDRARGGGDSLLVRARTALEEWAIGPRGFLGTVGLWCIFIVAVVADVACYSLT